jgi:hypothetical protein
MATVSENKVYQGVSYFSVTGTWGGEQSCFDEAHVVAHDGRVVAVYAEPADRQDGDWSTEQEEEFRGTVHEHIEGWAAEYPGGLIIQYDPGRDQCEEEVVGGGE